MLSLPPTVRVFVAVEPVDMRGSFDALAGAVRRLGLDPVDRRHRVAEPAEPVLDGVRSAHELEEHVGRGVVAEGEGGIDQLRDDPIVPGFVALAVVGSVLTVFAAYGAALLYGKSEGLAAMPGILAALAGIIAVVSPILGIASWFRGKAQADPNVPTVNRG